VLEQIDQRLRRQSAGQHRQLSAGFISARGSVGQ
jgi:hypothetical protein